MNPDQQHCRQYDIGIKEGAGDWCGIKTDAAAAQVFMSLTYAGQGLQMQNNVTLCICMQCSVY